VHDDNNNVYYSFVIANSHEVLVHCGVSYNNESSVAGSSRSLNRNVSSPTSNTDDPTFWVPANQAASTSQCSDIHSGVKKIIINQTLVN
jgi:hypothetical protein